MKTIGLKMDSYSVFLSSIPYKFYVITMLFFIPITILMKRELGSMFQAEERAIKKARIYKNKHPRYEVKMKLWEEYASDRLIGTPEQCVDRISEYLDAGMQYCVLIVPDMHDYTTLSLIGDEIFSLL